LKKTEATLKAVTRQGTLRNKHPIACVFLSLCKDCVECRTTAIHRGCHSLFFIACSATWWPWAVPSIGTVHHLTPILSWSNDTSILMVASQILLLPKCFCEVDKIIALHPRP